MCSDYWAERKSARMPTETYKSTTQHTTGGISHRPQCLFTRTTPRNQKIGPCWLRLCSLNSSSLLSLWKNTVFVLQYAQHFIFYILNVQSLCATFFLQLTSLSSPSPSSIITFSPSLSCLIGSTPPSSQFPLLFPIFLYNTICLPFALAIKISPFPVIICLWQLGRAQCVEIYRSTVCGVCVCTGRHWVNVIKGWCSIAKRQMGRQEEREGVKTSLNFYAWLHFNRQGWRHDHMFSWDFRRWGRKYRAAASARSREKIGRRWTEEKRDNERETRKGRDRPDE